MLMGLAWSVVQFERRLLDNHERLNTRLQQAHANLERTPFLDALTGLPNRVGMEGLLRAAADRAEAQAKRVALLFIGLDGFKTVNESYGHAFGDTVLREIALRLGAAARDALSLPKSVTPTLARVGGDEFVLMLPGEIDRRALSVAAGRLLELLTQALTLEEREVMLSASIGIACFPDDSGVSKLIAHADAAMQAAKHAGGSTYLFFEARMHDDARERMDLLRDLRRAVEDKQLELFYQPKIDARSGQVTAAEALLRWHHPTRGMISPAVFIPIAERYGLISTLGNWVIEDACRQARVWRERGLKMRVAINLSAYQMRQDDLVERIQAALKRHGIDPSRLTCEITESVAMEDTQVTQKTFERLGEAGIHLSIDDFGTGYSSLAYLRKLPASELKIDRSFVMDLGTSEDARAIVDAVLKLAHAHRPQGRRRGRRDRAAARHPARARLRRIPGLHVRPADVGARPAALGHRRQADGAARVSRLRCSPRRRRRRRPGRRRRSCAPNRSTASASTEGGAARLPTIGGMNAAFRPYTRAAELPRLLAERIVILDGAMGTMIQRYKLTEADYRGERFKDHPKDLKGNNELLQFSRPDVIRDDARGLSRRRRRHRRDQHLRRDAHRPGRLRPRRGGARDERRRGPHRARRLRQVQHAGQAALRRRRARPDAAHGEHQPGRERPGGAQRHLR